MSRDEITALRAREEARIARVNGWRACQVEESAQRKIEIVSYRSRVSQSFAAQRSRDPRLPLFEGGDVPRGGTDEEIRAWNAKAFRRDMAADRFEYMLRKRAATTPTPTPR